MTGEPTTTHAHRRRVITIGGVTVAILAAAGLSLSLSAEVDTTRTVQPRKGITRVEVDIDAGAITLLAADDLTVTVKEHANRFAARPAATTEVTDGTLHVSGSCSALGVGRCHTPVTIATPPGVAIHARTVAGSIHGEIVQADLETTTGAGSISLTVTGDVRRLAATTTAGPISLVVPDDVYAVDARASLGRTHIEVDTDDDAPRVIQARSEVGPITIQTRETAQ